MRRRRRPDYSGWTLWRLHDWDVGGIGKAIGFVATTADRFPMPIAFVKGTQANDFSLAKRIRDRGSVRETGRKGVMALNWKRLPQWVVNLPMLPFGDCGRPIQTARATFEAGMYSVEGFCLIARGMLPYVTPFPSPELIKERRLVREDLRASSTPAGAALHAKLMALQKPSGGITESVAERALESFRTDIADAGGDGVPPIRDLGKRRAGCPFCEKSYRFVERVSAHLETAHGFQKSLTQLLEKEFFWRRVLAEMKQPPDAPDIAKLGGNVDVRELEPAAA